MSRLTRDGTAEPVTRDQTPRRERGQRNIYYPCSAGLEQDRQPYPVDPYSAISHDFTFIHTYIHTTTITVPKPMIVGTAKRFYVKKSNGNERENILDGVDYNTGCCDGYL